jgi:hypothetical protein
MFYYTYKNVELKGIIGIKNDYFYVFKEKSVGSFDVPEKIKKHTSII